MEDTRTESSVGAAVPTASITLAAPESTASQRAGTTAPTEPRLPEAPEATVLPQDEWAGRGGNYVIGSDGVRRPA
jgi:hypothetical protein